MSRIFQAAQRHWDRFTARRRPVILMYHQIADLPVNPANLAVSPRNFEAQIEALCSVRHVVPLADVTNAELVDASDKPLVAITFDDGYRNVVTQALPVLEKHRCPATLFVSTGTVNSAHEFWWDKVMCLIFESFLPDAVSFTINNRRYRWKIGKAPSFRMLKKVHDQIWLTLRSASPNARRGAIDELAAQIGAKPEPREAFRIVSDDDLASLKGSTLSIGAHSVSHPDLTLLNVEAIRLEIEQSRDDCLRYAGGTAIPFSYPFGLRDDVTIELARGAGFSAAVVADPGVVRESTDRMLLPRYQAFDLDAEAFLRSLP